MMQKDAKRNFFFILLLFHSLWLGHGVAEKYQRGRFRLALSLGPTFSPEGLAFVPAMEFQANSNTYWGFQIQLVAGNSSVITMGPTYRHQFWSDSSHWITPYWMASLGLAYRRDEQDIPVTGPHFLLGFGFTFHIYKTAQMALALHSNFAAPARRFFWHVPIWVKLRI